MRGRVVVVGAHPVDLLALCRRWLVDSHVSIGSLCSTYFREKTSVLSYDSTVLVLPAAHADAVGKQDAATTTVSLSVQEPSSVESEHRTDRRRLA